MSRDMSRDDDVQGHVQGQPNGGGKPPFQAIFYWCWEIKRKKTRRRRRQPEAGKEWGREKEGKGGKRKL